MKVNGTLEVSKHTITGHALCELVKGDEIIAAQKTDPDGDAVFDVVLTINGIERPLEKLLKQWAESYDEAVAKEARKLIERVADNFQFKLTDAIREVVNAQLENPSLHWQEASED